MNRRTRLNLCVPQSTAFAPRKSRRNVASREDGQLADGFRIRDANIGVASCDARTRVGLRDSMQRHPFGRLQRGASFLAFGREKWSLATFAKCMTEVCGT
jgi:hypothetical protein